MSHASPVTGIRPPELVVRLETFEGPLDVLLHLVRTGSLDAAALPVAELARQYDRYLDVLGAPDPEEAGEALLQIATLVYMKSRGLLPADPLTGEEADAADPRRATEADAGQVRMVVEHLREREAAMELVFRRAGSGIAEFAGEEALEADLYALVRAFRDILGRLDAEARASITRERVSLVERIHWLMDRLQAGRRVGFRSLFEGMADRLDCILTFLALLEVLRLRLARAWTSHHGEDILIVLAEDGEAASERPQAAGPADPEEPAHA